MDSLDSSILEILLLCVIPLGIGLLVVLGIRGLPLSRRGIRSAIQMDGATFLRTDEANIRIRRRTVYLWFVIAFFGLFALGWMALIAHGWAQRTGPQDPSAILGFGAVLLILGSVLFVFIRLLGRPSVIQIDGISRTMTLGKGIGQQQVLFSELRDVLGLMRGPVIHILIMRNDERPIAIGSVSGPKAKSRAVDIVQQIAQVTGAKIREF
jgi:hypothetical protein